MLVALVFLAALGLVLCGPMMNYFEKSRIDHAVENARGLNLLLSQDALDNDNVYPTGVGTGAPGTSEGIARNLLADRYATTSDIFAITSAHRYAGTASDFSDFGAANIDWDFTAGAAGTGITSAAPDLLPTVYATGEAVTYPTAPGTGLNLALSGRGPFAKKGTVVADKNGDARFVRGARTGPDAVAEGFIAPAFAGKGPYTQIKP